MTNPLGLYIHIPFCEKKCAYCDFYSVFLNEKLLDNYTNALKQNIIKWGGSISRPIDTIYFGGGTPSLLRHRLPEILECINSAFTVSKNAEITLELNPTGDTEEILSHIKKANINRLSIGAQSGNDSELKVLGRNHTPSDTVNAVSLARSMGFSNISLDVMLGLPSSNIQTLKNNLDFILSQNPEHISAYILKIEPKTAFSKIQNSLNLPNEEAQADQYLFMCDYLEKAGYIHYEISNFCKKGFESRHNIKYWQGKDYLGIGAAAHSLLDGKRFYYPNDIKAFIKEAKPIFDETLEPKAEYIMLSLRLNTGICFEEYKNKFGENLPEKLILKAGLYEKNGLVKITKENISLTDNGMLLSNSIITQFLEEL